jgi:hypothetical protein
MSLMELMVALAILSLVSTLAFSSIGPWLAITRSSSTEAVFWRSVAPTQLLLSELATGAIEPRSWSVTTTEARFRALAPRLSVVPIDVVLTVQREQGRSRLMFSAENIEGSVLIDTEARLRFASDQSVLRLERERAGEWTPISVVSFVTNAPFVCAFDPIPRTCR